MKGTAATTLATAGSVAAHADPALIRRSEAEVLVSRSPGKPKP
jgi:hypothetical protein